MSEYTVEQITHRTLFREILDGSPPLKYDFEQLSEKGQFVVLDRAMKAITAPVEWKVRQYIADQRAVDPAVLQRQAAELEKAREQKAETSKVSAQQTIQAEKETPRQQLEKSNSAAARDRAAAEQDTSDIGLRLHREVPYPDIRAGGEYLFRAIGQEFHPLGVAREGFRAKPSLHTDLTVLQVLTRLFCEIDGGAADYLAKYRLSPAANDKHRLPFISAGPLIADSQGASNGYWQYAITRSGLRPVPNTSLAAQLPTKVKDPDKNTDVTLYTDSITLSLATMALLKHGPLGEETWITPMPGTVVVAFTRLGGRPWARRWTLMRDAEKALKIADITVG